MVGTHGRTGLKRALMGSTAEALVANANCPVVTVRYPSKLAGMQRRRIEGQNPHVSQVILYAAAKLLPGKIGNIGRGSHGSLAIVHQASH